MSTPGRRKALKKLAARKRANVGRVARGLKPIMRGKQVSLQTFNKRTGAGLNKTTAKKRQRQQKKG